MDRTEMRASQEENVAQARERKSWWKWKATKKNDDQKQKKSQKRNSSSEADEDSQLAYVEELRELNKTQAKQVQQFNKMWDEKRKVWEHMRTKILCELRAKVEAFRQESKRYLVEARQTENQLEEARRKTERKEKDGARLVTQMLELCKKGRVQEECLRTARSNLAYFKTRAETYLDQDEQGQDSTSNDGMRVQIKACAARVAELELSCEKAEAEKQAFSAKLSTEWREAMRESNDEVKCLSDQLEKMRQETAQNTESANAGECTEATVRKSKTEERRLVFEQIKKTEKEELNRTHSEDRVLLAVKHILFYSDENIYSAWANDNTLGEYTAIPLGNMPAFAMEKLRVHRVSTGLRSELSMIDWGRCRLPKRFPCHSDHSLEANPGQTNQKLRVALAFKRMEDDDSISCLYVGGQHHVRT